MHNTCFSKYLSAAVVVALLFVSSASASFFSSIKRFSIEDGLPATTIYSMLRDNNGYFWLGTPSGLVRFDGYDFEVYSPNNSNNKPIRTANAGNIFLDSQNRLWIGSWGKGVAVYDDALNKLHQFEQNLTDPNALQSNMVQVIFEDQGGQIWLGTNGGGLAKFNEANLNFTNFVNNPDDNASLSHNRVWSIAQDKSGNLWVGTGEGLNLLPVGENKFQRFTPENNNPKSIDHPIVRALMVDDANRIWVGTELSFGQFMPDDGSYRIKQPENSQITASITRIRLGVEGEIWIGTQKGLYRYQPENDKFTPLVNADKYSLMPHDDIRDIYVDKNNAIWVATRYAGLSRIEFTPSIFKAFRYYSQDGGIQEPIKTVYSLYEDSLGNVWVGTSEGLLLWTPESTRRVNFDNLPNAADIYTMEEDDSGNLWIGLEVGLGMLPLDRQSFVMRNDILKGFENLGVNDLHFSSRGEMWITTNHGGVVRYGPNGTDYFKHDPDNFDSISTDSVNKVFEDSKGRMWFSTNGTGANRLDPGRSKFFHYNANSTGGDTLLSFNIYDIFQSADGTMWFGGSNSLDKLDDVTDTFDHFTRSDGLANSNIRAIIEDDFGDLWLSTDYGISQYKRTQKYFVNYLQQDGLHDNHFFQRSALKSERHGIFFGGNNGFTQVAAVPVAINPTLPEPQITGVWVDGKKLLRFSYDDGKPLQLSHTVKNIEIRYSALDFTDPDNNQYKYRLVNFNDEWSSISRDNEVSYSGLDSGNYIFELRASNNNNVWSASPLRLEIDISTPWWRLWWLRLLLLLAMIAIAIVWYKHRTRALASQKRLLEEEVSLRTDDLLNAQKQLIESEKNASLSGLVAGVAHEINTPVGISVTAASNLLERTKQLTRQFESGKIKRSEFSGHIKNINDSAEMVLSNLTRAAELIRSFKEVSVDQISQQRRSFNFAHYMDEIIASLRPKLKKANVSVEVSCPKDINLDSYPGAIAQLVTNLTINAIVHAFDGQDSGQIDIAIEQKDELILLTFCDNGKGIPADQLDKIFEPFYTTKRGKGGSGLGLQIISNIVNIRLGGNIRCESEVGKGTCFYLSFLASPK